MWDKADFRSCAYSALTEDQQEGVKAHDKPWNVCLGKKMCLGRSHRLTGAIVTFSNGYGGENVFPLGLSSAGVLDYFAAF